MPETSPPSAGAAPYRVLARTYRPQSFDELIGQEAMVTTLTNAFALGRIAHAYVLTGVRGVGKTTTARILAKGLNCEAGAGPTIAPCGVCPACTSIAAGRNTDVLEMDAASNTSVNDVREIIESVRYRASAARYKVYIIDEVHMLSTSAFNALLKTLEEPPEHVVFIFATTEIRKVPLTVLSRCQRFDLRRIGPEALIAHLARVAAAEGAEVEPTALGLIARAAEGSARDALSLLDQALALGSGPVTAAAVRAMMGVADRARVIDLFEAVMGGDAAGALRDLGAMMGDGADPAALLSDLAELAHWISVLKIAPELAEDPTLAPEERARGRDLAARLSMRSLGRAWQMLLKAMEELPMAPSPAMAAEMAVIRLTHVADLPPPEDLVRRLVDAGEAPAASRPGPDEASPGAGPRLAAVAPARREAAAPRAEPAPEVRPAPGPAPLSEICDLLEAARELRLLDAVERFVEPVTLRPGLLEFSPAAGAPADLAGRLSEALRRHTGARWSVVVTDRRGAPSRAAERARARAKAERDLAAHPLVARALEVFPGAVIRDIRSLTDPAPPPAAPVAGEFLAPAAEEGEDGWEDAGDGQALVDPFEED